MRIDLERLKHLSKLRLRRGVIVASDQCLQLDEHTEPEDLIELDLRPPPLERPAGLFNLDPNPKATAQHRADLPRLAYLGNLDVTKLDIPTRMSLIGQQICRSPLRLPEDQRAVGEVEAVIMLAALVHEVGTKRPHVLIERNEVRDGSLELNPARHGN